MATMLLCVVLAAQAGAPSPGMTGRWVNAAQAAVPGPAEDRALEIADQGDAIVMRGADGAARSFAVTEDRAVRQRARRGASVVVLQRSHDVRLPNTTVRVHETITLTPREDGTLEKTVTSTDGTSTTTRTAIFTRETK